MARTFFRRHAGALIFAGAFLAVLGSRLVVLERYGTDLPYLDEWGKIAGFVLKPLLEGDPAWLPGALLPHNEHRIYFTVGSEILLVLISGQWDARQQCVLSAALFAIITASLALFAWRRLPRPVSGIAAGFVVGVAVIPLAWPNIVWGFQSQFYYLIGFSLLGIDGLLRERFSARWFVGLLALLCALVTMGSGFLAAAAVLPFLIRDAWIGGRVRRSILVSLLAATLILLLGWQTRFEPPWHSSLRPETLEDFLTYAAHCLAWPLPSYVLLAPIFYGPLLVLGTRWLKSGAPAGDAGHTTKFILTTGSWVLLQIAALAYARGQGGGLPANRYGDVFFIGIVANAFALGLLTSSSLSAVWKTGAAVWLAAVVCAASVSFGKVLGDELPNQRRQSRVFEASVRAYVADGDAAALRSRPIPFNDYDWFLQLLDRPSIRAILPASVNDSRRLSGLSKAARRFGRWGWLVASVGIALLLATLRNRSESDQIPNGQ